MHSGLRAGPRSRTIGPHDQSRRQRLAAIEAQLRIADAGDQCGVHLAVLDDPRQRPLAELIGGESELAARIAANVHRFDRTKTIHWQPLPRADAAQERGAARADGIDTSIPVLIGRRNRGGINMRAIDNRHPDPCARQRCGERQADETRAEDGDVVVPRATGHQSRTSMTWF
jgi:hypothetical protein